MTTITSDVVVAYSLCPRKAFLLLRGESGAQSNDYIRILEENAAANREAYLNSLNQSELTFQMHTLNGLPDVVLDPEITAGDLRAHCDLLIKSVQPKRRGCFEPHIVVGTHAVSSEHHIRLAFVRYALTEGRAIRSAGLGAIITLGQRVKRISLSPLHRRIQPIVYHLRKWIADSSSESPPVILNNHCPICPFQRQCQREVEATDGLGLLARITPKLMQRYHRKGIFTVNQLSYVFKPRRRRRRTRSKHTPFSIELQALALRTGKVYVHEKPDLSRQSQELFLDVEGIPDRQVYYLIGLKVSNGQNIQRFSFWNDGDDEKGIFSKFHELALKFPGAPIYHYGSYETKALDRIERKYGMDFESIRKRLVNLSAFVYGKVYFPSRSNSLKAIGKLLGSTWTAPEPSGLQSLVWRHRWEQSKELRFKRRLLIYNQQDCDAVQKLANELQSLQAAADSREDVDYPRQPKEYATDTSQTIHDVFEAILKSAQAVYQDHRIQLTSLPSGKNGGPKKRGAPKGHQAYQRIDPPKANRIVEVVRRRRCPSHKGLRLEPADRLAAHMVIDLKRTSSGFRKVITKYVGIKAYCSECRKDYVPLGIAHFRQRRFGHAFQAWAVYQRMVLRLPYRTICDVFDDMFGERINPATIMKFFSYCLEFYKPAEQRILERLGAAPFIHVDETKISIDGVEHYVWVLTDGKQVVFRMTETRETTIIQDLLNGYQGVLVCDFYGGYDAVKCRQQRCLVHLIRDMNDDLWKNPFNREFETFLETTRDLLVPVFEDVQRHGLKRRYLHKHRRPVDRFYKKWIDGWSYECEITAKYQKRFLRYRESLFMFLEADGIPWNNNTAERAIRHLAIQRKISRFFFERGAVQYLRMLGISQTCRFQGKSFLNFLLSGLKDVNEFKQPRRKRFSKPVGPKTKKVEQPEVVEEGDAFISPTSS